MKATELKNTLTRRQRQTCALSWGDQLPHAQIAATHGVSHWATKKRVQRARRRLRAAGIIPPGDPRSLHRRAKASQLGLLDQYV
jgi:predicted RNA polymerase sigma factor